MASSISQDLALIPGQSNSAAKTPHLPCRASSPQGGYRIHTSIASGNAWRWPVVEWLGGRAPAAFVIYGDPSRFWVCRGDTHLTGSTRRASLGEIVAKNSLVLRTRRARRPKSRRVVIQTAARPLLWVLPGNRCCVQAAAGSRTARACHSRHDRGRLSRAARKTQRPLGPGGATVSAGFFSLSRNVAR